MSAMDGYAGAAHRTTGMPDESNENRPTGSGATTKDNGTPWLHLITLKNRYKARTMENANLIDGAPVRRLGVRSAVYNPIVLGSL